MKKITQQQYRQARKILDLSAKQSENYWVNSMKPIIKKYDNTFWKKTESMKKAYYFNIQSHDNNFVIISLISETNGGLEIKKHWVSPTKIDDFLGKMVERNDYLQDEEEDITCDCPQLERGHYREQHNPLKQITKRVFEKQVKKQILDELQIGLNFTVSNKNSGDLKDE